MVKIKATILLFIFAGIACAISNVDGLVPKGWQKGNGLDKDLFPSCIKMDIDRDSESEIILHSSHKEKGDYLPSKHILSIFDWNGREYVKKWGSNFNVSDNIFFLIEDVNRDKKLELIVNGYNSGNAGLGHLWIFKLAKSNPIMIFDKDVQGDIYLWNSEKLAPGLEPDFFPDLDNDGAKEIVIGRRGICDHDKNFHSCADMPWWYDVYRWNGKAYVSANSKFPKYFQEQLDDYKDFVKEKGECETVRKFIEKAERLARGSAPAGVRVGL